MCSQDFFKRLGLWEIVGGFSLEHVMCWGIQMDQIFGWLSNILMLAMAIYSWLWYVCFCGGGYATQPYHIICIFSWL